MEILEKCPKCGDTGIHTVQIPGAVLYRCYAADCGFRERHELERPSPAPPPPENPPAAPDAAAFLACPACIIGKLEHHPDGYTCRHCGAHYGENEDGSAKLEG